MPEEGILLQFGLKMPGSGFKFKQVSMDFKYDKMSNLVLSEAYEKLILDCIIGDEMMFSRSDTVDTSWKFIDPILKAWKTYPDIPLYGYPFGTWGPVEADQLLTDGRVWSNPCKNLTNTDSYCLL